MASGVLEGVLYSRMLSFPELMWKWGAWRILRPALSQKCRKMFRLEFCLKFLKQNMTKRSLVND